MKFSVETIDRKDYAAVRGIIADSYKNDGPNTDGDEVDMVDRLRSSDGYNEQFEVVAKDSDHRVIGHALMVPATVRSATVKFPIVSIVEIGVLQGYRNDGVGQEMVIELETRARLAGYHAVSAIDNSDFFFKNNYVPADNFNILPTVNVDFNANLIKPLFDGALFHKGGKIYYPEEYFGVRSTNY
ncbi:N-acetyltransferase [Lentilactobacillus otakiensis]|uniref:N-acetyltransferase GCN5 n=1 Tax=Lentilactobacillus otakiensis DSM 19908 = JCM 15040 TaxID=1423780 RepID=S4NKA6_9LACO|nr:N-acetyltransferase [Lentilactobacillus otakiensis]KRL10230.1 N-acetyltransferase GCN5 [Lentilactobacillus otakiensis DSM 19908 = JCM 15040]MBZ3777335.1 N-acetyltransferase [Lentilactobacillus otakiensis]MDV3518593.1 N-acetyltransferase [Lentilactobacillus otakiensis]GAD16351.1 N-acetyltransferase GCN5 [Lentilactobacillus otakiensis DSM 19908 = JCM 15040]